jgi:formylglycine-generating enzyme required for sulfatase activity
MAADGSAVWAVDRTVTQGDERMAGSILRVFAVLASAFVLAASSARAQSCGGDINGDGSVDSIDLAIVLSQWGNCPANITSVSPSHGSVLGGTVITITGTGLASTSAVRVGGVLCTNLEVLSATQVRATTPAGEAGEAAIEVTTPAGTSLSPTPFTYVVQSVTSITPASGPFSGGTPITITGQFLAGTTAVTIGGVPATSVVAVNSTTVTAVTPAGSVGAAAVVVIGAKGTITVPGGFTYLSFNVPAWATLIQALPDPAVVTDAGLRSAIIATGWAWRVRDNSSQIEMLLVPPGTFNMGCSLPSGLSDCGSGSDENPVHAVTLTNAFYIGRYEVTQAQWTAKMGSNPSFFKNASAQVPAAQVPNRPVEGVSLNLLQSFLAVTGLRLPTEAEWEFAYRAGTTTAFHSTSGFPSGFNDGNLVGNIAWFTSNSASQTRPVGGKPANALGLHDMSGNVREWVNDWYSATYYASSPSVNPPGPAIGAYRVARGGAWYSSSGDLRSSSRAYHTPDNSLNNYGLRIARNP